MRKNTHQSTLNKLVGFLKDIVNYPLLFGLYPDIRHIQYYPVLLGLYPAVILMNVYVLQTSLGQTFRAIFFITALVLSILFVVNAFIKERHTASLLTVVILFLFYSYGMTYAYLKYTYPGSIQHRTLSIIWILLIAAFAVVLSKKKIVKEFSQFFTVMSASLLILGLIKPVRFEYKKFLLTQSRAQEFVTPDTTPSLSYLPDIYYIVLDGHTRSDVMLETYDYDDSDFQNKLDTLGFFVGKCSQTNYWTTEFAMSAILNMEYVDTFFDESKIHSDWSQSTVIKTFVELGYTTISFETRAINNNRQNLGSDINFSRSESENSYRIIKNLNLYELRLAEISWSRYWLMGLAIRPDNEAPTFDDVMDYDKFIQYQETHYYLETLEEIPHMDVSPKFVYAQFFVPHAPFIFNPEGGFVPRQFSDFLVGYKHNAIFIDAQIIDIAEKIIELSENPPIIIIQGDHGRHGDGPKEHTVILNAYYLPDGGNQQLYDSISPINSFRMIFDTYFSTDYGLLEDKSYYAYYTQRTITGSEIVPNYCDIE